MDRLFFIWPSRKRDTHTKGETIMTASQFNAECLNRAIAPSTALENEAIIEALKSRDDAKVVALLDSEF